MTDEEKQKVLEALRSRVRGACTNCGARSWSLGNVSMPPEISLADSGLHLGGNGVPMVSVVCTGCGLMQFFAGVPLGLFPAAANPQDSSETP